MNVGQGRGGKGKEMAREGKERREDLFCLLLLLELVDEGQLFSNGLDVIQGGLLLRPEQGHSASETGEGD